MTRFNEKMIQETAYYIWKNNGCPADSSAHDWNAAIELLERKDALETARQISALYRTVSFNSKVKAETQRKKLMKSLLIKR